MRVVFFGNCADYSLAFAEALVGRSLDAEDRVQLVGIVCPQRFASRRRAVVFSSKRRIERLAGALGDGRVGARLTGIRGHGGPWQQMHRLAQRADAPIIWPVSTADADVLALTSQTEADVVLVAGLDRILGERTIAALPPVFNLHPSLLPDYRGGVPEFWQLADGATTGGVTLHRIDGGIDTGPVVFRQQFAIAPWFDAPALIAASISPGITLMNRLLDGFPDIVETPVTPGQGSYQPLPTGADRVAPFGDASTVVIDRARAVGWGASLLLHVPRRAWLRTGTTTALSAPTAETLTLSVSDPMPFAAAEGEPPGTVAVALGGGVVLACNPGVVYFRRAEETADG